VRAAYRKQLKQVQEEILASVPGTAVASDQQYREADLAIDYCEDVPRLNWKAVEKICSIFKKHGAACKISSIHVNGWFGTYDKLEMTKRFAAERWCIDLDQNQNKERFIFCGDSPNDEPMFKYFPHAVGVNNLLRFSDQLQHLPSYVARFDGGEGFAEIVDQILHLQNE
ncbi:MAG: HAD family hydrolase, partial [Deltaproteobacteria bacterium]|nr:HAD family hydrolase [Deltaproteobacteria bacterium]